MLDAWKGLIGAKYSEFGETPKDGFCCYGLVRYVSNVFFGQKLPDHRKLLEAGSTDQERLTLGVGVFLEKKEGKPEAGDVVALNSFGESGTVTHIGIMVDSNRFIHASDSKRGVILGRITSKAWKFKIKGFYRWQPSNML